MTSPPKPCIIQNQRNNPCTIHILPQTYISRPSLLNNISSFLSTNHDFILITGEHGSGKTTLLADWIQTNEDGTKRPLFCHFFGISSCCLHTMLIRLYEVINDTLGEGEKIPLPNAPNLLSACPKFLDAISAKGGIVIILDAVDLLPAEHHELGWLPKVLPDGVHIIVSSLPGKLADEMEKLGSKIVQVPPFQNHEKQALISKRMNLYGKELSPEVQEQLLSHKLGGNVLFLSIVLDELCNGAQFVSFAACNDMISLFNYIIAKSEQNYGVQLTKKTILLITGSRCGLEESVIQQIAKVPAAELAPLLPAIRSVTILMEGKLIFPNKQFIQAITMRYPVGDLQSAMRELVDYYWKLPFTKRNAYELPWLLSELAIMNPSDEAIQEELADILLDLDNFNTFNSDQSLQYDVVLYWNTLQKLHPEWQLQLYINIVRVIFKKANSPDDAPTLQHLSEWLDYAGAPLANHLHKQLSRLRAKANFKQDRRTNPPPKCYMCKQKNKAKFKANQSGLGLCVDCLDKNEQMMDQWDKITDIDDCVALVTGARIKIGYHIALRLLRSGATVIAVTRFPHDAALKYSQEPDFEKWKHKLHIYGLDLRHLLSVNQFIAHVLQRYTRIDMLINNAAQTKRRPRAYYNEAVTRERSLMGGELNHKYLVKNLTSDPFMIEYDVSPDSPDGAVERKSKRVKLDPVIAENNSATALIPVMAIDSVTLDTSLPLSAALTQVPLHPMDLKERDDELFPPGLVDEHNEPLDLRPSTTWDQQIQEVSALELMEVQIINATVPFMLISAFTPLLKHAAAVSHHKRAFVVNVTAVEGLFYNVKSNGGHPHTNMAKAALNMLTKSISNPFAIDRIYTTAVDTGWCTEMRYVPMDQRDAKGVPLKPVPLTDKDGASRVLYPIFVGLTSAEPPPFGVLYHNYQVVPWT